MNHDRARDRPRSLLAERADLDEQFALAWCIGPTGRSWPWVVDLEDEHGDGPGCMCWECAPDEQDGPLSAETAQRLQDVTSRPPRCGGTRRDGGRCRVLVPAHGRRCRHHDTAPTRTREDA